MSGEQSGHEELRPDQSRDAFEAALAALRPRVDGSQGRTEFIPCGRILDTNSQECLRPAGHEFVCAFCGQTAPNISRSRRWAWPSALAVMTAAAAVLLAIVIADHSSEVAVQSTNAPTIAHNSESRPTESTQPLRQSPKTAASDDSAWRLALWRQPGRVLSTADSVVRDDIVAADSRPASPAADRQRLDSPTTDSATLRTLMSQFGVFDRSTN